MRRHKHKSSKLLITPLVSVLSLLLVGNAYANDCKVIQNSQKKYAQLGQKELKRATEVWLAKKNSFSPSPEYYQFQKESSECRKDPKKYAKKMGDARYAEIGLNGDGTPIAGPDGKPIRCWPLIAKSWRFPGSFQEPKPRLDYQDSFQISQVIIYNNPQCFDAGLVVKVQRWVKAHPSALR